MLIITHMHCARKVTQEVINTFHNEILTVTPRRAKVTVKRCHIIIFQELLLSYIGSHTSTCFLWDLTVFLSNPGKFRDLKLDYDCLYPHSFTLIHYK
jgi:hypothetical protein